MLALVAGQGALPVAVASAQSKQPLICALAGHVPDGLHVDIAFRIEHLGTFITTLKNKGTKTSDKSIAHIFRITVTRGTLLKRKWMG